MIWLEIRFKIRLFDTRVIVIRLFSEVFSGASFWGEDFDDCQYDKYYFIDVVNPSCHFSDLHYLKVRLSRSSPLKTTILVTDHIFSKFRITLLCKFPSYGVQMHLGSIGFHLHLIDGTKQR